MRRYQRRQRKWGRAGRTLMDDASDAGVRGLSKTTLTLLSPHAYTYVSPRRDRGYLHLNN